jgi:putative ABC transport system substrate-binding protein
MELVPASRHMAALADPTVTGQSQLEALRSAAASRGVELSIYPARGAEEIASAVDAAQAACATALDVLASPILNANRRIILDRTAALRLPAMYQWPETAEEGGLAAYGPRLATMNRMRARQVVKALRGAKPADIPVEQPDKFELIINLRTAKAIGLEVPGACSTALIRSLSSIRLESEWPLFSARRAPTSSGQWPVWGTGRHCYR